MLFGPFPMERVDPVYTVGGGTHGELTFSWDVRAQPAGLF